MSQPVQHIGAARPYTPDGVRRMPDGVAEEAEAVSAASNAAGSERMTSHRPIHIVACRAKEQKNISPGPSASYRRLASVRESQRRSDQYFLFEPNSDDRYTLRGNPARTVDHY